MGWGSDVGQRKTGADMGCSYEERYEEQRFEGGMDAGSCEVEGSDSYPYPC